MVATHVSSPQVFEGHPFIVEAVISIVVGFGDVFRCTMGLTDRFCKNHLLNLLCIFTEA